MTNKKQLNIGQEIINRILQDNPIKEAEELLIKEIKFELEKPTDEINCDKIDSYLQEFTDLRNLNKN